MLSISSAPHPDSWFNNCFLCLSRDSGSGLEWEAGGGGGLVAPPNVHPLPSSYADTLKRLSASLLDPRVLALHLLGVACLA